MKNHNVVRKLAVSVVSLGCSKNLVDAELMLGSLRKSGFEIVSEQKKADCILINTCSFLKASRDEAVWEIRHALKTRKKGSLIAVTGCFVASHKEKLQKEFPKVDVFVSFSDIPKVGELCLGALKGKNNQAKVSTPSEFLYNSKMPRLLATLPHYAYVKIADGCDNCCTYCTIPSIRGSFRSRPMPDIVKEVKKLVAVGVKEINLISQDTTRYGEDIYGTFKLKDLLLALSKIKGIYLIRILYMYPSRVTDGLLSVMAKLKNVSPYFDIPIQHSEDRILRDMNRFYSKEDILKLLFRIRSRIKKPAIRTTVITGFPGETKKDFKALLSFIRKARFNKLGAFAYSREEGTPASLMAGQVSETVKKKRLNSIMSVQQRISLQLNKKAVGSKIEVLVDTVVDGIADGRRTVDAPDVDGRVRFGVPKGAEKIVVPGAVISVSVKKADYYDLFGEALGYKT